MNNLLHGVNEDALYHELDLMGMSDSFVKREKYVILERSEESP